MQNKSIEKYTSKSKFEKSINTLIGIIEGIAIDSKITDDEIRFLEAWIDDHKIKADIHPFSEIFPVLENALSDCIITDDEKEDILWLCKKLTSAEYFNEATADMQKLHAVLAAVASDGQISVEELKGISNWLRDHEHLKNCWPYDEVESLILGVLHDKIIEPAEHKLLLSFFSEFVAILDTKTIVNPALKVEKNIVGLCSVCPEILFQESVFCFTGTSHRYTRNEFEKLIQTLGGSNSSSVTKSVKYLLVGSGGNPNWAFACYGRKVEKAVELRKQGHKILIVHENDFYDAVEDVNS